MWHYPLFFFQTLYLHGDAVLWITVCSKILLYTQVLLGEVNAGLSTTQVIVKELKASASVQDQMQFLEEAQPYRLVHWIISDPSAQPFRSWVAQSNNKFTQIHDLFPSVQSLCTYSNPVSSTRTLQHSALLQCLAQCSEVTPYLLVMEFCPMVGHTMKKFIIFFLCTFFFGLSLNGQSSFQPHFLSPPRVIWRATCAAVRWPTPRCPSLWSSKEWCVTSPQGLCNSTNTTLYTGQFTAIYLHSLAS